MSWSQVSNLSDSIFNQTFSDISADFMSASDKAEFIKAKRRELYGMVSRVQANSNPDVRFLGEINSRALAFFLSKYDVN